MSPCHKIKMTNLMLSSPLFVAYLLGTIIRGPRVTVPQAMISETMNENVSRMK